MKPSFCISAIVLPLAVLCRNIGDVYTSHEKRHPSLDSLWTKESLAPNDISLHMRIGLAQENTHLIEGYLNEVSDPGSESFGKHWTPSRVARAFSPSPTAVAIVRQWLVDNGISTRTITSSASRGWLDLQIKVSEAEMLLKTKYFIYKHRLTGQTRIACDEYHVPKRLQTLIDLIMPTVHIDVPISLQTKKHEATSEMAVHSSQTDLIRCSHMMTPDCLRAIYGIPRGKSVFPGNSLGVVEYKKNVYHQEDLDLFFLNYSRNALGSKPVFKSIDGGLYESPVAPTGPQFQGEADLDVEYAM